MRFLFLNQYAPPDPSPTARLLGELADHLRAGGHEVETVSWSTDYHGRPAGGGGRLQREMRALVAIFKHGWTATRQKPDLLLALSSPPSLLVVAALLARLRGVRLAHWAMDLYPELALELREIGPGLVFRTLRTAMRWAYRRCALIVALDEDMRDHLRRTYGVSAEVLAPWPSTAFERQAAEVVRRDDAGTGQPWIWLYSGNLGRAHEWETLLETQRRLEARGLPITLVFQGDGAARTAASARAEALALQRCEWRGYVPESALIANLLGARLLVVTQRPETRGLLWPSKLAALEKLPRPILFVGPPDGAIARRLQARGNAGVFAPGAAEAVAGWIEAQYLHARAMLPNAGDFQPSGPAGCATMERWLTTCGPERR